MYHDIPIVFSHFFNFLRSAQVPFYIRTIYNMDVELRKEQKDIEFKKMQRIYAESNMTPYLYGNKNRYLNDKSKEMVDIIHGNMDEIRYDESYAFHILKKIMPHEKVVKEILQY